MRQGERTILHIDMNAFFASVEQRADPALRDRPMAVIGSAHRGVVLSPSYEARAFGVRTGMTYGEARRVCPGLVLVPADSAKYTDACEGLLAIWRDYTPLVELFSIDEAFLDVTGCDLLFGDPVQMAVALKERIWRETGLLCSIGIGPNKLLAKLGSDMQKPDGLVLIPREDVAAVLEDLPVKDLCGVGPSLARQLAAMGIRTCGQLGRAPFPLLLARFGIVGERLREMGQGIDDDPVKPADRQGDEPNKSMGHGMTLREDCTDPALLAGYVSELAEKVGRRLRRGGYRGRTVTLTLRYADFHTFSRQRRLPRSVDLGPDIAAVARDILQEVRPARPVRLVGVSIAALERDEAQLALFSGERRQQTLMQAMDEINDRYGERTVNWAALMDLHPHERILSPAWRPAGDRLY